MRLLLLAALAAAPAFVPAPALAQSTSAVYVVSQGAFGANSANVVRVTPAGAATTVQSGRAYTQGAQIVGRRLYLTAGAGTDSRVDVLNLDTGAQVGQATGSLVNPRYLAEAAPGVAFVTNQTYSFQTTADPYVSVLDLATSTVTATIPVPRQPEGIAVAGGRAYVALGGFDERPDVAVLDVATRTLVGTPSLGCIARFVFADRQGEILAVCSAEIVVLDGATGVEVARVASPAPIALGFAQEAAYDPYTERLFAVAGGQQLVVFDTARNAFAASVPVPTDQAVTAVGYDPQADRLYLGRPDPNAPFSAPGVVSVHDRATGAETARYAAGIYPTFVAVDVSGPLAAGPSALEAGVALGVPQPNPLGARGSVGVTLAAPSAVRLVLVDALGRHARVAFDGALGAGTHAVPLRTDGLPAGVYALRLAANGATASRRVTVVREP